MKNLPLYLALLCFAALVGYGFWQHGRTVKAEARASQAQAEAARAVRSRDSLQAELNTAVAWAAADTLHSAGIRAGLQAEADEARIHATPAAGWDDDSLSRYLANPSGYDLHAPRTGR